MVSGTNNTLTKGPAATLHQSAPGRLGGLDQRHAAQRPQNDAVRRTADLSAGQSVSEFMQQDYGEKRKEFERIPDGRGIGDLTSNDLVVGDEHERPMHANVDAEATEEQQRSIFEQLADSKNDGGPAA